MVSSYGALGEKMKTAMWGSSRRAARHLLGPGRQSGHPRSGSSDMMGLQANIYETSAVTVTLGVTEMTANIIHKVNDAMVAELQSRVGVSSAASRNRYSRVLLLRRAHRREVFLH